MPYEVGVQQPHVVGDPRERDTLEAQAAGHGSTGAFLNGGTGIHRQFGCVAPG